MNEPMLDCLGAVQRLWEFTDGELDPGEEAAIRRHLERCTGCTEHLEFCRSLLRTLRESPVDPEALAALRERVRAALRDEATHPGG